MDFYHKHNSIILAELGDKKLTKEEQQQYYTPYMSTHLFTDYLPILQKYFSDIFPYISDKTILDGFDESKLPTYYKRILEYQAWIPEDYYKKIFDIKCNYNFPSIICDKNGFIIGQSAIYSKFENFKINPEGYEFIQTDNNAIDAEIETFIISNQITHIKFHMESNCQEYENNSCYVYPLIVSNCSAIYDTLYETDTLLKKFYNLFITYVIFKKSSDYILKNTFQIGIKPIDGNYKVSNLETNVGYKQLINKIMYFTLKHKLHKDPETYDKIKESYDVYKSSKKDNIMLNGNIAFENITYSFDDNLIQIHPLQVKPNLQLSQNGVIQKLPLFVEYFSLFLKEHFADIKKFFPIYERLENIYRMCGFMCLLERTDLNDFEIVIPKEELKYVDTYASSILMNGGIELIPKQFVKVPYKPIISQKDSEESKEESKKKVRNSECRKVFNDTGFICAFAPKLKIRECYEKNLETYHECLKDEVK